MKRAGTGADTRADIFLSRPPKELISPWKKKTENICKIIAKIKKVELFLHILPDSNQNRTENIAKTLKYPFFTPSISIQNGASVKLSNVMTSQQCQRGTQRFCEHRDQRNDQSRPLCVLRLVKSLNLVIVN